jgi:hypothetical protein
MPALIGRDFGIDPGIMAEAGIVPPQLEMEKALRR